MRKRDGSFRSPRKNVEASVLLFRVSASDAWSVLERPRGSGHFEARRLGKCQRAGSRRVRKTRKPALVGLRSTKTGLNVGYAARSRAASAHSGDRQAARTSDPSPGPERLRGVHRGFAAQARSDGRQTAETTLPGCRRSSERRRGRARGCGARTAGRRRRCSRSRGSRSRRSL